MRLQAYINSNKIIPDKAGSDFDYYYDDDKSYDEYYYIPIQDKFGSDLTPTFIVDNSGHDLCQLGTQFSSNNAGDGPAYNHPLFVANHINFGHLTMINTSTINSCKIRIYLNDHVIFEEQYNVHFGQMLHVVAAFINRMNVTTQLGVEYSSNNAGDGPGLEVILQQLKNVSSPIHAQHYKLIESIIFLIYDLRNCKCKKDIIIPILRFGREHYNGVILEDFISKIHECITIVFSMDLQSDDEIPFFEKMRSYLDDYSLFRTSPLFKKVYKLILYILSFTLFRDKDCSYTSFGYTALEAQAFRLKFHMGPDLVFTVLDTCTFLCEKGYQMFKEGYSSSIFHSSDKYKLFHSKCEDILNRSLFLNQTEALDDTKFLAELDALIEQGRDISKCAKHMDKFDAAFIAKYVNRLETARMGILTFKGATRARSAPYGLLLYGDSGIGKTTLIRIIIHQFCLIENLDDKDEYIYFRNFREEFWNNFRTCMHTVVLDDVASENPNLGNPRSVDEIISIQNDANCVPNQAALEDKGRIPLRCKLCIATTNVKNMNTHSYCSHPFATQRRLGNVITPTVKPEFTDPITGMLDPSKVPETPIDGYIDLWFFKVESVRRVPIDANKTTQDTAKYETVLDNASMAEFIAWLTASVLSHRKNSDQVKKSVDKIRNIEACRLCCLPEKYCQCELQSASIELLQFAWYYTWVLFFKNIMYSMILLIVPRLGLFGYSTYAIQYILERPQLASALFQKMGEKVVKKLGTPKNLIILGTIFASLTLMYKTYKATTSVLQGANQSKDNGRIPDIIDGDDNSAVWYKSTYELTTFDVTRQTLSSKGLSVDQLSKIFHKNCISVVAHVDEFTTRESRAFCITGQLYVANNHSIPMLKKNVLDIIQQPAADGITTNITYTLCEEDIYRIPDSDLCCFIIRNLPPKKNLTQYFPCDGYQANTHAFYLSRLTTGEVRTKKVSNIKRYNNCHILALQKQMDVWHGTVEHGTINGDCGSILVSQSELGFVIVGLHMLGEEKNINATVVHADHIKKFLKFGDRFTTSSNPPVLQCGSTIAKIGSLHAKSTFRYLPHVGTAAVFGSVLGFRAKHKSRVEDTILHERLLSEGYQKKFGVPVLNWIPWNLSATHCTQIPNLIDTRILDECSKSFTNDILSVLTKDDLSLVHVYDMFTALNGANGVNYVDKIPRNTSAGFPLNKCKKYFIYAVDPAHDLQDPIDIDDDIKQSIEEMMGRYKNGERAGCVFMAHLKDEPTSFAKIEAGKTRVFSGASFPMTIIVRKYLLSIVRVIQENKFLFEAAVGINAQSLEWDQLHSHLIQHGENKIVAGDYVKYDKQMAASLILSAFDIIVAICKYSGNYTDEDITVIRGIAYDISFAYVNYNGDLAQFFGSNPSGHPLTVIINCLVNSLYVRYAYYRENPKQECHSFKQNVKLMTYGDDNIMGISDNVPWFHHTSLQRRLQEIKVGYTMADKLAASVPYISIVNADFLKRSWRYDSDLKKYLGALDVASIEKMMMTWVKSKSITSEEQAIAIVSSAVKEYFFHGKDIFDEKRTMLKQVVHDCNLNFYVTEATFPTWGVLAKEFVEYKVRSL